MTMTKPNCYECRWRGDLPGDAHSCCNHPALKAGNGAAQWIALQAFYVSGQFEPWNVTADPHGIKNGWFLWPINFDPIWLLSCDGFQWKEVITDETKQSA